MAAASGRGARMIGRTLGFYIASRFTRTVIGMIVSLLVFIVIIDFVEQLRKAAEKSDVSILSLLQLSALKAPIFLDKAFPFACLFAAMLTLTQLNQKMELVVARAAGVSAWQFLMPASIAAVIIGVFATLVYNPVAVTAFEMSQNLETRIFDRADRMKRAQASEYWIRQEDKAGTSVINARIARQNGQMLDDVRVLRFNEDGTIYERIDAKSARFADGGWILTDAEVTGADAMPKNHASYEIDSQLTADTLAGVTTSADSVPVWGLPAMAAKAQLSGSNPGPYLVQFHSLLSLPLFLVAMVLIAATVSLRFVRFGQVGRMILGGIICGFVLYTVTKLVTSLGSNGIVPPAIAAWSPSIVAIVFGISILLHQEDG
jgi:lipopolysaccharide export system permease protein